MNIKVGSIPNLLWLRLQNMSDEEIKDFNNRYTIIEGETKMTDDNLDDTQQYTSTLQEHDKAVWNEAIEYVIQYIRVDKQMADEIRKLKK